MISRELNEWQDLRFELRRLETTEVWQAITDEIRARIRVEQAVIEDPNAPVDRIRVAQGAIKAHKRDIIVLRDLVRQADKACRVRKPA